MRKLTRKSLSELAQKMPVLSENVQSSFIGGGNGTSVSDPYTFEQYKAMGTTFIKGWVDLPDSISFLKIDYDTYMEMYGGYDGVSGYWGGSGYDGTSGYWDGSGNYWDNGEGDNNSSSGNYYTYTEAEATGLMESGRWNGGYVEGIGYVLPEVNCIEDYIASPPSDDYFARARSFEGTPYLWGGVNNKGIDCSGLICAACNLETRWTTNSGDIPGFQKIEVNKDDFWTTVQSGDILVWKGKHVAIYVGGTSIYHSSRSRGVGQTNDLERYWMAEFGTPTVYRK